MRPSKKNSFTTLNYLQGYYCLLLLNWQMTLNTFLRSLLWKILSCRIYFSSLIRHTYCMWPCLVKPHCNDKFVISIQYQTYTENLHFVIQTIRNLENVSEINA